MAEPKTENWWLNRKQASDYLASVGCPLSPQSLAHMAVRDNAGAGPPFTRISKKIVRYHRDDLRDWANRTARRVL
jgi:hypothetical protein